jgi:hypothetical protein
VCALLSDLMLVGKQSEELGDENDSGPLAC